METKKELIENNDNIIKTSDNSVQLNYKSRLSNKINRISKLIREYVKDNLYTVPYIIQELQEWLHKAKNTSDETESELQSATLFIKNYLKPIENEATLLLKIALPTLFNTQELAEMLKNKIFSQNEQEAFKEIYLKNILETKLPNNLTSGPTFFSLGTNVEIQKTILINTPSCDLIKTTTTNKLFQALTMETAYLPACKTLLIENPRRSGFCWLSKQGWILKTTVRLKYFSSLPILTIQKFLQRLAR